MVWTKEQQQFLDYGRQERWRYTPTSRIVEKYYEEFPERAPTPPPSLTQRTIQVLQNLKKIADAYRPDDHEYLKLNPEVDKNIDAAIEEADEIIKLLTHGC